VWLKGTMGPEGYGSGARGAGRLAVPVGYGGGRLAVPVGYGGGGLWGWWFWGGRGLGRSVG
jgi:hypothetical protein